ncbi:Transmembrane protein [Xanthomonas citri pv. fuscans]|nr:Transmembrane protein [Xanthomonas citri pv. fuscans]SOO31601.1 Transmembrane protein [Xanthomonas citri pv. fuscans]
MTAVYCRAYLVTLGMLLAGGPAFVALAASDISGAGLGLALLICAMGVLLLGIGVAGPSRQMEAWADAASGHEVALVLMALAYPVYLLMAPFYARP